MMWFYMHRAKSSNLIDLSSDLASFGSDLLASQHVAGLLGRLLADLAGLAGA
jgi:hypothetical protein